jgi:hypothetical protein
VTRVLWRNPTVLKRHHLRKCALLSLLLLAFAWTNTVDARAEVGDQSGSWIGTWGVAPQPPMALKARVSSQTHVHRNVRAYGRCVRAVSVLVGPA